MAKKDYTNMTSQEFQAEKKSRTIKSWQKQDRAESSEKRLGVFNLIILVLMIFAVFAVLNNRELLTFKGLLQFLQTCPQIDLDFLSIPTNSTFPLLNFFGNAINAVTFVLKCSLNAIMVFIWLLRELFL